MNRDLEHWAKPVDRLGPTEAPAGVVNANVAGRRMSGAIQGFGRMWQKTFSIRLGGIDTTPQDVVRVWKERYPDFWPKGNRFFVPQAGIAPGEVGIINASLPGAPTMATGVLVVYADDESFTFMTPEGHPFAGWITFSASAEDGVCVASVQEFIRASDPLWELMMATFLGRKQNQIWIHTLRQLAAHLGATGDVETSIVCVDRRRQWSHARNVWQNAGIRSGLGAPARWLRRARRA